MIRLMTALFFALALPVLALPVLTQPAMAQTSNDLDTPARNAVVSVGPCSGTLLTSTIVLTVAHCLHPKARAKPPFNAEPAPCTGLTQQAGLAYTPWEDPFRWYKLRSRQTIKIGAEQSRDKTQQLSIGAVDYAIAHCADLVLLRMRQPVPASVATPMPAVVTAQAAASLPLSTAILRYAGWGAITIKQAPRLHRATGDAALISQNACHLFALPPLRITGARILPGDSGSPLLYRAPDGQEAVLGVLYGRNVLDPTACQMPVPLPPGQHGTYTPTWRPTVSGTDSTDIGAWLQMMVRGLVAYPQ